MPTDIEPTARPNRHLPADGSPRIPPGTPVPTVSVVVPALDEAENLPSVLPRIPLWVHEVILVDDGSTDDTVAVARRLLPSVRVVRHGYRRGKGAALLAGMAVATGDAVVTLDADGSADPDEIVLFVEAIAGGADLAKGSRFLPGAGSTDITRLRRAGNRCFVTLVRVLYGRRYTDLCQGYNAVRRSCLHALALDATGFEIEAHLNLRAIRLGLRVVEVPTFETPRLHGRSRLNALTDGWRVLRTIVRERRAGPPAPR